MSSAHRETATAGSRERAQRRTSRHRRGCRGVPRPTSSTSCGTWHVGLKGLCWT